MLITGQTFEIVETEKEFTIYLPLQKPANS
jgi:hypothetical protein